VTPARGGWEVDADRFGVVLRLLDHQIVGEQGQLLGNVDDLALEETPEGLFVVGLLSGPAALGTRLGGWGGRLLGDAWRRLRTEPRPHQLVIPLERVVRLDSAVHVDARAGRTLAQEQRLELWLREHVVARIPGAMGGEADPDRPDLRPADGVEVPLRDGQHTVSELLALRALGPEGAPLGEVIEVTAERVGGREHGHGDGLGPLRLVDIVCSPRHLGQELGYTLTPQGPRVVRWVLRACHRSDRHLPLGDVAEIDWGRGELRAGEYAVLRHPHAVD
jgi:hypothetical protein